MIQYAASTEASFSGMASQKLAWYQLLRVLETYQLRNILVYLELAIWKHSMLSEFPSADAKSPRTIRDIQVEFESIDEFEAYKQTKRVTSGATEIVLGVMPFLREYPAIE